MCVICSCKQCLCLYNANKFHLIALFVCIRNCLLFTVHICTIHLREAWHFPLLSILITVLLSNEIFVFPCFRARSLPSEMWTRSWHIWCSLACIFTLTLYTNVYCSRYFIKFITLLLNNARKLATTKAFGVKKRHAKKRETSTGWPRKDPVIAINDQLFNTCKKKENIENL